MTRDEYEQLAGTAAGNSYGNDDPGNAPGHVRTAMTYGWWAQQRGDEFWPLLQMVGSIDPQVILEIGGSQGGSTVFWDHLVGPAGTVMTIDGDTHCCRYSMFDPRYCRYRPVSNLQVLRLDSHGPAAVEWVRERARHLDVVFVDGDHSYTGAAKDYQIYWPLVRAEGLMVFHDVNHEPGIARLSEELKASRMPRVSSNDYGYAVLRR